MTDREGRVHEIFGKGAGRCPTAEAVFADVMDAQRSLLGRHAAAGGLGRAGAAPAARAPLKLKLRA